MKWQPAPGAPLVPVPSQSRRVYGEISLGRAISLILGLQNQILRLERELEETKEATKEARDWMGAVDQALTRIEARGGAPHTPEDRKPPAVEATPRPLSKTDTFPAPSAPLVSWAIPSKAPPAFAQPTPVRAPPRVHTPPPPSPIRLRSPQVPQPAAPVAAYQTPVKVDHPDAYTGKIGNKARQWLTRMLAWVRLNQRMFPTDQEVLSFLLMNMKDVAGAWAHPHLDQLGSHRALIQSVDNFRTEFLAAFGNPDATRAAERQITHLTQTGTCAEYITKFRTIAMDLDWNDAALRGQFARGLHWERRPTTLLELQNAALVIDNALREERASHPPKGNKSGTSTTTPNRGASTGQQATRPGRLSSDPNFVSEEERNRRRAEGLCIKCSKVGHKFAECCTGWKATPKEEGVKKEVAKIGKDSKYQSGKDHNRNSPLFTISIKPEKQAEHLEVLIDSGATLSFLHPRTAEALRLPLIDLPTPRTVTMLDGSSPQAGKIWKKAVLTFTYDGKKMTETFLICNTGSHAAILGLKWLDAHNPEIDWNTRTLSFPHTPPEHVAIAKEEEADPNPLEGVPSKYHQYAKVFGEEEFNQLPPHRHYDIGIELTEEGPLNLPLYSMTNAKSATLKDWLRDKLKAGKIRPSKSSISSPVMFVPKKDGSRRLVVDYRCLNNRTKKNVYPLPRPNDLMAQLRGAKVFTKLDLRWGYNNVRVKEGNEWKTAFRTKYGLYESLVMTFGLTNAPAAFQHFMNKLFKDLLDVCVIIYLDDILIYSKDDATPLNTLDKLKIQAVQEWPTPTKPYGQAITYLVKKDVPWRWDTREQEAFQGLKDAITNAPVLCHADPSKPYFLETDASGAALDPYSANGRKTDAYILWASSIIRSFEYWRIFLEGTAHPITVFTDHRNLEYWKESRTFNQRHARWHLLLAGYNFQIVYHHAPQPCICQRCPSHTQKELQRQIKASLDQDESLEEILQFLQNESKAPPSIKQAFKDYQMEAACSSIREGLWYQILERYGQTYSAYTTTASSRAPG
ncbi:Retrotransposable element Tf2 protein [Rhizoctonia solani]|uniref:RNA-directed DNA polymerase n=1 Tax=Rhizoctonia solani TaxID=456999 RepID=A0A8H8NSQ3_9AGAM|nr:Retrotransposable element Tf2 protein [Rhizoctonia solani]QRW18620.1 Retrotransposable element Tf2 protein [Rhizoctonia solani]